MFRTPQEFMHFVGGFIGMMLLAILFPALTQRETATQAARDEVIRQRVEQFLDQHLSEEPAKDDEPILSKGSKDSILLEIQKAQTDWEPIPPAPSETLDPPAVVEIDPVPEPVVPDEPPPPVPDVLDYQPTPAEKLLASGHQPRLLIFTSSNCPPCQLLKEVLRDLPTGWTLGEQPTDHIQMLDIDDHPDIAKELGIDRVPTIIRVSRKQEDVRILGVPLQGLVSPDGALNSTDLRDRLLQLQNGTWSPPEPNEEVAL